jgi:hypothetical protein
MTPEEVLAKIAEILKGLKISYAITGGFAVSVWGKPRYTADIDIVVELMEKNIKPLAKELQAIDKDVYADEDMIRNALTHKSEFNFIHPDSGIKVDFFVMDNTAYNKVKIKRAILRDMYGAKAYFVTPEDLILGKLVWAKESESQKQYGDIKTVLRNTKIKLDFKYLKLWAAKQGTVDTLNKLIKEKEIKF